MRKVGVIGSGIVGQVLANGFDKHGYDVMIGSNTPSKLNDIKAKLNPEVKTGSFEETALFGEMIVLAVKGSAAEAVVKSLATDIKDKVVIDTTNPIADLPPVDGVIQYFTDLNTDSLMERLQRIAQDTHFVKAFNSVGNAFMVNPDFGGIKPTMFICGNNAGAKKSVTDVLDQFGFETQDLGMATAARAIEPLCILWCIPGFLTNSWSHAFKLLKK